jgi:bifunctional enzyme CysN/CysC
MPKEVFRVTSAGSVDDGKSTILARLLLDTGSIYADQITKDFDPNRIADLLDGLESERDQGITIDVAHRFFDSTLRRYHIADSPGHEQYTRNMATACAGSNALMLVVDATAGLKPQTLHHLEIALRLGLRDIVFAVNKIDLINFNQSKFEKIKQDIEQHLTRRSQHFKNINHTVLPVSGLKGDNVVRKSKNLSWFDGPTLIETFDALKIKNPATKRTVFETQLIQRLAGGGRRYLGRAIEGPIAKDQTLLTTAGEKVKITGLLTNGFPVKSAKPLAPVSLELDRDLDIDRGELLASEQLEPHDQFEVDLIWFLSDPGIRARRYILLAAGQETSVSITKISQLDLDANQQTGELGQLEINQIARCNITTSKRITLEPFATSQRLGRFVLIDPSSGQTAAVGTVNFSLRRSDNLFKHDFKVTREMREEITGNRGKVLWFTGLSGSGKSTIANALSVELYESRIPHYVLDGDDLRLGINNDLSFTEADRAENVRRTAEIAALMADAGLIVMVCLVSPYRKDRALAREIIGTNRFEEIYVATPLEVCIKRDPKGLYAKALAGSIPNFTGINAPYEEPGDEAVSILGDNTTSIDNLRSLLIGPKENS